MKTYELKIEDDTDEVFAISLVENPAIEENWMYFKKETQLFQQVDTDKRMIVGPILIPNKKILRVDGEGDPYQVFFSAETVKELAQNYLKKKYTSNSTLEHEKSVNGVYLVESWIKEGKLDKSNTFGLNLPEGTWMGVFKIEDDEIWNNYVKTGKVQGFSIEGLFSHELVRTSNLSVQQETYLESIEEQESELILSQIIELITNDSRDKTDVEMESYSDYGDGVKNNAKRGIDLNKRGGNKCATAVGKVRAQQLAAGKPLSVETIKRMYSYLSRAETYYDESDTTACGTISFLLWGGKAGLGWSRNKLRELGLLEEGAEPSITSTYPGEVASGSIISPTLLENIRLPKDKTIVLQADDDAYDRGLNVTYKSDGGYDVNYWYEDPSKVYPAEVVVNDTVEIEDAVNIYIGYHPELK